MAFGDVVQTKSVNSSGVTSLEITFDSVATAGNLLIVGAGNSTAQTWGSDPSGWTALTQVPDASGNMSAIWYYKIAAGGEASVTISFDNLGSTVRLCFVEYEGSFAGSPLDVTAEDESNISSTATSQTSGTTGTTTQADELVVAFFASDAAGEVDAGRGYTNSFTEDEFDSTTTGRAGAWLASKVVAAISTYTTTFSTTDTGDEMYGAIAAFKKLAAGGGGIEIFRRRRGMVEAF